MCCLGTPSVALRQAAACCGLLCPPHGRLLAHLWGNLAVTQKMRPTSTRTVVGSSTIASGRGLLLLVKVCRETEECWHSDPFNLAGAL